MINILCASFPIFLLFWILSVQCGNEYEALHFTRQIPRKTLDKEILEKFLQTELAYRTAIACPAKPGEEDEFNKNNSFGKNSLFVRKTYEEDQTLQDVEYYTCENPYQMSVLYHNGEVEFQFGFEVYFDKSEYGDKNIVESNRGDYNLITNTHDYVNYIKPLSPYILGRRLLSRIPLISKYLAPKPLYLDTERKKEMGFLWIDSMKMKFDSNAKRVSQVTYSLAVVTRGLQKCDNYDLGNEFFGGTDMQNLYSEENQIEMLTGVEKPSHPTEFKAVSDEMVCDPENECFIKWSTAPAELFHHLAIEPTSCSDLLTVAVWKTRIYHLLTQLDNFLYALSMVIGHPLGDIIVHSGVHGVLELPTKSYFKSKKPITLTEKGIQVPNIIYKIVRYETKRCREVENMLNKNNISKSSENAPFNNVDKTDESNAESDKSDEMKNAYDKNVKDEGNAGKRNKAECEWATSSIIIIVHNNPYFDYEKDHICKDQCREAGMQMIKNHRLSDQVVISSSHIYCCPTNDPNVRKKLGIEHNHDPGSSAKYSSPLFSLNGVPMFDYDTNQLVLRDVSSMIGDAYDHLFEGAEYRPDKRNELKIFVSNYHIKMGYFQIPEPKNDGDEPDISKVQGEEQEGGRKSAPEEEEANEEK